MRKYYFFRSVGLALLLGVFTANCLADTVEVLVVGGGGGGGGAGSGELSGRGGGGGGGVLYNAAYTVAVGSEIPVTAGTGGAPDANGNNSVFGTITAIGGGRGATAGTTPGIGGSGGGGNYQNGGYYSGSYHGNPGSGTPGQGSDGGWGFTDGASYSVGGGGGGAGGAGGGQIIAGNPAGAGGVGLPYSISGATVYYGGGGGGGGDHRQSYSSAGAGGNGGGGAGSAANGGTGTAGAANTGGGGGGGAYNGTGGVGGSGVVIVRYAGSSRATGGSISQAGGYTIHTFTGSGVFTMTSAPGAPSTSLNVDALAIGGGGGGGSAGGGGGAGGVVRNTAYAVSSSQPVAVTIGDGGAGGVSLASGSVGGNSSFGTITAYGGGFGGGYPPVNGGNGASGGGSGQGAIGGTGIAGQGNSGGNGPGNNGGGGGGYGSAGSSTSGGSGYDYFGIYYAAGGGGCNSGLGGGGGAGNGGGTGGNATANSGSGGGGGGSSGGSGGNGGSGIVIVRYPGLPRATGGTITSSSGYTIHTFTSSGTFQLLGADQTLPFFTSFESADGYVTGSVHNQDGWMVMQGAANVSTADYTEGTRSLVLESGGTPAVATMGFAASSTPAITFIDFEARPVAASTLAGSSLVQTEAANVGFQFASGLGEIYTYDGVGTNQWVATGWRFVLNGSSQSADWLRLTLRLDYTAKTWDLFVDGEMADFDLAFSDTSEAFFRQLVLTGASSASTSADAILISDTNPLFTDADKDGMDDAWETAHGLDPAVNDRNGNFDGDALTNIQEFFIGTKPNNADVTKPSTPAGLTDTAITSTSIDISWSASTDTGAGTPGVAGYNVYRDGVKVNTSLITTTSFSNTGLTPSTIYAYTVRAVDLAGNLSDPSSTLNLTTLGTSTSGSFEVFTPLP